jgi:hypothetical protein
MWSLAAFHHISFEEQENMMPWIWESVCALTAGYLEQQEMQRKQAELNNQ